jgi:hypothetical protein
VADSGSSSVPPGAHEASGHPRDPRSHRQRGWFQARPPPPGHLLPVPPRPGPSTPCAASMSRSARPSRPWPDRVRSAGGQPVDRARHWLVHPQVRQNSPPLPDRPDPGRHTSSPLPTRYPANSARPSKPSTPAADLRTSLAEVRLLLLVTFSDHRCRTIRSSESVIERACGLVSLRAF